MSTETDQPRRTKRRYAHELYPHAGEWETRPLAIEVPYAYAHMVGLSVQGTGWFKADPITTAGDRTMHYLYAARIALMSDAMAQGLTGDAAWAWVNERVTDDMEVAYDRATHYGVPIEQIKPYPCGPEPDHHDHIGPRDQHGWSIVTRIPTRESDCPDCTEPTPEVSR